MVVARLPGVGVEDFNRGLYLRAATYDGMQRDGFDRNEGMVALASPELTKRAHNHQLHVYEVFLQPVTDNHLLLARPDRFSEHHQWRRSERGLRGT